MKPLQQFEVKNILPLQVAGVDISLTNSGAFMLVAVVLILLFLPLALRKKNLVPSSLQILAELPLQFAGNLLGQINGEKGQVFLPLIASIFLFVFMGNALGLLPYCFTFTGQFIVNFFLALIILTFITGVGIVRHGVGFLRLFCPKGIPLWIAPILIPVEIISYLARPLSLAVRLFANMVAGHSMLKILSYFTVMMGWFGFLPFVFSVIFTGFEVLVAFLQAYVFTMLSCIYLNDALDLH